MFYSGLNDFVNICKKHVSPIPWWNEWVGFVSWGNKWRKLKTWIITHSSSPWTQLLLCVNENPGDWQVSNFPFSSSQHSSNNNNNYYYFPKEEKRGLVPSLIHLLSLRLILFYYYLRLVSFEQKGKDCESFFSQVLVLNDHFLCALWFRDA